MFFFRDALPRKKALPRRGENFLINFSFIFHVRQRKSDFPRRLRRRSREKISLPAFRVLHRRDGGLRALQLLRHARHPHALHRERADEGSFGERPGRAAGGERLRDDGRTPVHDGRVFHAAARGVDRGQILGALLDDRRDVAVLRGGERDARADGRFRRRLGARARADRVRFGRHQAVRLVVHGRAVFAGAARFHRARVRHVLLGDKFRIVLRVLADSRHQKFRRLRVGVRDSGHDDGTGDARLRRGNAQLPAQLGRVGRGARGNGGEAHSFFRRSLRRRSRVVFLFADHAGGSGNACCVSRGRRARRENRFRRDDRRRGFRRRRRAVRAGGFSAENSDAAREGGASRSGCRKR